MMKKVPSIRILRTRVDMVEIPDMLELMAHWIENEPDQVHHIVNTGMHGIIEAHKDPEIAAILDDADLLAPDGILAILVAKFHGYSIKKQETGPGLLRRFSEIANRKGYSFFFYGDTVETLELLSANLKKEFPNLRVVGQYSPPFRALTRKEEIATVVAINQARPDVLWVSLGMPKQERWIAEHRNELEVPVAVGAGASFKFLSGTIPRAPALICNLGFEWLWRLAREPQRVWRRVVFDAPTFIGLVFLQLTGLRKYD